MSDIDNNIEIAADDASDVTKNTRVLPLLRGETTLATALEEEDNMIVRLEHPKQHFDFFMWIYSTADKLLAIVAHHLGLNIGDSCHLSEPKDWIHGSFNVCIAVEVERKGYPKRKILLRMPLPYKIGETQEATKGNAEEKLRTEAATFIYIQQNCPDVPIPFLWGFGFPGTQSFCRVETCSLRTRFLWHCRYFRNYLTGQPLPHRYIPKQRKEPMEHGYLIMDCVEEEDGQMLSRSWKANKENSDLRHNLFTGLARIMLSLGQVRQHRIGSWTIDNSGNLSLNNRPLIFQLQSLESEGVATGIPRTRTYESTDSFYADLLTCHDNRILYQPNSINGEDDGFAQMANLFAMRGLIAQFTEVALRHGPFALTLTDLHTSNIFVDRNWNIKCIVDLEWACSLPIEMLNFPYWIAGRRIDEIDTENEMEKFVKVKAQFMEIFEQEERALTGQSTALLTETMHRSWHRGRFVLFMALLSTKGCFNMFRIHLQPLFDTKCNMRTFTDILAPYWSRNATEIVRKKLADKKVYEAQLEAIFNEPQSEHKSESMEEEEGK